MGGFLSSSVAVVVVMVLVVVLTAVCVYASGFPKQTAVGQTYLNVCVMVAQSGPKGRFGAQHMCIYVRMLSDMAR